MRKGKGAKPSVGDLKKDGSYVAGIDVQAVRGPRGGVHGFHVKRYRRYGGSEFSLTKSEARKLVTALMKELL